MKKEDNSWDFLINCNENQWQLVSDVMEYEQEDVTDSIHDVDFEYYNFPTRYVDFIRENAGEYKSSLVDVICSDEYCLYMTYGKFICHIVEKIAEIPKEALLPSGGYERVENILLLSCLKSMGESHPKFFKTLYNLASSSAEDVAAELEVRFNTSPALRASLPAVLCTMLAKDCSVELSSDGKKAVDENLTLLEQNSLLGNYNYVGSLAKLESLNPLWLLGGPVGMIFGMLYEKGKKFFSEAGTSTDTENESAYNDEAESKQTLLLACTLIMLRRQNCDTAWNETTAYRKVCSWMMTLQNRCIGDYERRKKADMRFVENLFLQLLKRKDETKYRLIIKACGYDEKKYIQACHEIDSEIERLLPHSAYLVGKLWHVFGQDRTKGYAYTTQQITKRMKIGRWLVTEFNPDFVGDDNSVHFLVDDNTRGITMLCLELMGHDSTVVCKDYASLKKEYRNIFVSNNLQREKLHPYCYGKVYSLYEKFDGSVSPAAQKELEEKELREKLQIAQEELKKCHEQIAEYERNEEFYKNAFGVFRHNNTIADYFMKINMSLQLLKPEGNDFDKRVSDAKNSVKELSGFINHFGRIYKSTNVSISHCVKDVFEDSLDGIKVLFNSSCDGQDSIAMEENMFKEWVLESIKGNIIRHAFPKNHVIVSPKVKIDIKRMNNKIILSIANNGKSFDGENPNTVFEKGKCFGITRNTGEGLYYAKWYMENLHPNGSIMFYSCPEEEYKVIIEITFKISK